MAFYDGEDGTKLAKEIPKPPQPPTSAIPYPNGRYLGQEAHEDILRQALAKYGVRVELGVELVSFTQDGDQGVQTVLRHVGDGREENAVFQWVIGADGGRSTVRKTLGLKFLGGEEHGESMIVADIRIKSGVDREHMHMWGTPRHM